MNIRIDPENNETKALDEFASKFEGKRVLEVGCGDGRATQLYASFASSVLAIDPDPDDIAKAKENLPPELLKKVQFEATSIEAFSAPGLFDAALLSWSL